MVETHTEFESRIKALGKKHTRMYSAGYITRLRKDGLIVAKPVRRSVGFPLKGLVLVVLGFFAFKAFMLVSLGDVTYTDRLALLAEGTVLEQAGAYIMQIDPVTRAMVDVTRSLLH